MGRYSPNIIANYLSACALHNPDGEALCFGQQRMNRQQLRSRVFSLAQALKREGIHRNHKVNFLCHNTPQFVETNYAVQVLGAIPVPLNYRFTAPEIIRQVNHSDAVALVYDALWEEAVGKALPRCPGLKTVVRKGPGQEDALDYEELVAAGEDSDPAVSSTEEDVAAMIYTGGTTGPPKGVMLTYGAHLEMFASMLAGIVSEGSQIELTDQQLARVAETAPVPGAESLKSLFRLRPVKRVLGHPATRTMLRKALRLVLSHPEVARLGYEKTIGYMVPSLPFFHDASYMLLMLGAMVGNLRFVLAPEVSFDVPRVAQTIQTEKPFLMANVPTGWKKLVHHPHIGQYDLSSIRVAITGAGVCPLSLKRAIFERFPEVLIIDMFGQTEMTPLTSFRIDANPSTLKERSVGRPMVEARIQGERGEELPRGEVGQIVYRSSTVMRGYYKDREGTEDYMGGGWCKSGDLGYMDGEGELRVVDRIRECINTGGEKVFPLEVEEVIQEHRAVEAACIVGVPDEEWGHTVRAVVQLKAGQEISGTEIVQHCRGSLAGYKVPRSVVFVEELPLSPVGKVLRGKIRELYGA